MLKSHTQSSAKCFEDCLSNMVRILASNVINMKSNVGVVDKALKKFNEQINIEFTNHSSWKFGRIL